MIRLEKQHCDQCENQCPVDALQCGRGRRHFSLEKAEGGDRKPHDPIGLMRQCGHLLHHGGMGSNDLLSALNPQEQAELERLLSTLLADWTARMPAGAEGSHHTDMTKGSRHGHRE